MSYHPWFGNDTQKSQRLTRLINLMGEMYLNTSVFIREIKLNKILEEEMIGNFDLVVVTEIRGRVRELKMSNGENWKTFVQAMKEEIFMEDSERVTKRTFLEWIARPNKDLLANKLLREFERQYA